MKDYYNFLKEELNSYEGNFPKYVLYIPDFFRLLCRLLDEDLSKDDKKRIYLALAYFVMPNDVIPEDIFGPAGYIDDMFVCCHVLNEMRKRYGIGLLDRSWEGEEDIDKVLCHCFAESRKELEEKGLLEEVMEMACLE